MSPTGLQSSCPQCGAPLHFGGASSLVSICSYCRSAVARSDAGLELLGQVPDLVATDTRLALGMIGQVEGRTFTVLGRVRLSEGRANWDEWYAIWADGSYGWIAEAQGRLIVTRHVDATTFSPLPPLDTIHPGSRLHVAGVGEFVIEQVGQASLVSAQGELPFTPHFQSTYRFADASMPDGGYVTLDYGSDGDPNEVFAGREFSYADAGIPELAPGARSSEARGTALECPSCGAPLSLKTADSQSVVCPSCRGLCDLSHGKLELVAKLQQRSTPQIPLGTQGTLFGQKFEVLGWLRRCCTVDNLDYYWSEYLLHGAVGYRWLSEANGHWMFLRPLPAARVSQLSERRIRIDGRTYRHFVHSHEVRYTAIQGEFYWHIRHDDVVNTDDYVAPPYVASRETQTDEVQWSGGEYLPADVLWKSFSLPDHPPSRDVISPCEPNPHAPRIRSVGKVAAFAACALSLLAAGIAFALPRHQVQSLTVSVARDSQIAISEPFDIRGTTHAAEVEARMTTPWDDLHAMYGTDPWVGLDISLINDTSGAADSVGLELWNAAGGDGSQPVDRDKIGTIPPGRYVLRVEAFTPPGSGLDPSGLVLVSVKHGVFLWFPWFAGVALLLAPPIILGIRSHAFERRRWQDSDYPTS